MTHFRGLTWDHPRGTAALRRAAARFSAEPHDSTLGWDSHSLEDFESRPVAELCERYHLVVLDHPHLGDALAAGALQPLDALFPPEELAGWRAAAVGNSAASYTNGGRLWAAPLDVATQVAAAHRARVPRLPRTWDEVTELAAGLPVALSLAGPHALLTFLSVCLALGETPYPAPGAALVSREVGRTALELMRDLAGRADPETHALNPIALLERIAAGDRLAYCPFVYGYAGYAARERGAPVRFGDVPRLAPDGPLGSTLGGTGLAVTRGTRVSAALVRHLGWLMSTEAQRTFLPGHAGQPARREAWTDPGVNAAYGGFYADTLATTERAWVRPRHPGYPAFQAAASAVLREAVTGRRPAGEALDETLRLHRAAAPIR